MLLTVLFSASYSLQAADSAPEFTELNERRAETTVVDKKILQLCYVHLINFLTQNLPGSSAIKVQTLENKKVSLSGINADAFGFLVGHAYTALGSIRRSASFHQIAQINPVELVNTYKQWLEDTINERVYIKPADDQVDQEEIKQDIRNIFHKLLIYLTGKQIPGAGSCSIS